MNTNGTTTAIGFAGLCAGILLGLVLFGLPVRALDLLPASFAGSHSDVRASTWQPADMLLDWGLGAG